MKDSACASLQKYDQALVNHSLERVLLKMHLICKSEFCNVLQCVPQKESPIPISLSEALEKNRPLP